MYERRKNWIVWEGDFVLELTGLQTDAWWANLYIREGLRSVRIWAHGPGNIEAVRKEGLRYLRAMQDPTDTGINAAA